MTSSIKIISGFSTLVLILFGAAACDIDRPMDQRGLARQTRAQIRYYLIALEHYKGDLGGYPSTKEGLRALRSAPSGKARWNGPYLEKDLESDGWGRPYRYLYPGTHGEKPEIISYGRDGEPGGTGLDEDITSWTVTVSRSTK